MTLAGSLHLSVERVSRPVPSATISVRPRSNGDRAPGTGPSDRETDAERTMTIGEMLVGRLQGPLTLRLVIQPVMAAIFAVRAGLKDAREGRRPYLWKVVT